MAGGATPLEIPLSGYVARMPREAFIGQNAASFVAFVAEPIGETAFGNIVSNCIIIGQQPLIFGTVRAAR